ncbi:hypothetical protein D3C78_361350 [compost metagenome]
MTGLSPIASDALARARQNAPKPVRQYWTIEEEQQLALLYPDTPMHMLMEHFGRQDRAIYSKAKALGLSRSPEYLASPFAGRIRPGAEQGKGTRFQKGQRAWNTGISYQAGGRASETQFKKGSKPHTWVPIGTEQIRDGYLWRKITDHGGRHDWRQVHVMLWEQHHGQVPAGLILVFRDRNKQNIQLDNLELITRAENCRRNSIHRYPPELKDVIRLQKKLERTIRKRRDEEPTD